MMLIASLANFNYSEMMKLLDCDFRFLQKFANDTKIAEKAVEIRQNPLRGIL